MSWPLHRVFLPLHQVFLPLHRVFLPLECGQEENAQWAAMPQGQARHPKGRGFVQKQVEETIPNRATAWWKQPIDRENRRGFVGNKSCTSGP